MFDPTFTATNAHLNDLGRARRAELKPLRERRASGYVGTLIPVAFVGIVATGLIALQGVVA